jgi:hypothetical protein
MTSPAPLTADQVFERYGVRIPPERLAEIQRQRRLDAGPPFYLVLDYPRVVTTEDQEDEAPAGSACRRVGQIRAG